VAQLVHRVGYRILRQGGRDMLVVSDSDSGILIGAKVPRLAGQRSRNNADWCTTVGRSHSQIILLQGAHTTPRLSIGRRRRSVATAASYRGVPGSR